MRARAVVAPARDKPSMHAQRGPVSECAPLLRAQRAVPSVRARSRAIGAAGTMASRSASYRSDVFRKAMTPTETKFSHKPELMPINFSRASTTMARCDCKIYISFSDALRCREYAWLRCSSP